MKRIYKSDTRSSRMLFGFFENEGIYCKLSGRSCEICGSFVLNIMYVEIIERLLKKGLLDQNYKLICCDCYDKNT